MKSILALGTTILAAAVSTGCLGISIGGGKPPPATVVAVPAPILTSAEAATIAEIDAVAKLSFDNAKRDALVAVASRPDLPRAAQVHLVNTAYRKLSFDKSRVETLSTLIKNPGFSDAAKQAIVTQIGFLSFDADKQAILRELNERAKPQGQ